LDRQDEGLQDCSLMNVYPSSACVFYCNQQCVLCLL
jgi:hypothetical protein